MRVRFRGEAEWRTFAMVVACTGYEASTWRQPCLQGADVRARAHFVGFGAAPRDLLPLQGIGREASRAARIIAEKLYAADLSEALFRSTQRFIRGNHFFSTTYATCLTQVFFKSGEACNVSKCW